MDNRLRRAPCWGDFVYEAFYAGGIGGSVVALFFLLWDSIAGDPLFTPSLMGSVLFGGASAELVNQVRMDMVARYTIVHFATFGLLGACAALAAREAELRTRNPVVFLLALLVLFEAGFYVATSLFLPGVMARLGVAPVAMANVLTAGSIAIFLVSQRRPALWRELRQLVGLA